MTAPTHVSLPSTAADLMTTDVLVIHQDTLMREAACLLYQAQVSGAPVVDDHGTCVGVLSSSDFVRMAGQPAPFPSPDRELPLTCGFQRQMPRRNGHDTTVCTLPLTMCPLQRKEAIAGKGDVVVCSEPHSVPTDWQVVNLEKPPVGTVRRHMTPDPVTVERETPIEIAAQRMVNAGIHRLIVVDNAGRPVGIVSSTDILLAVAQRDRQVPRNGGQVSWMPSAMGHGRVSRSDSSWKVSMA
jgi:CBS domain-containing protein